jgi:HD-GYP domain-containing protein (c-di-GMP phosphodiesterase class II)
LKKINYIISFIFATILFIFIFFTTSKIENLNYKISRISNLTQTFYEAKFDLLKEKDNKIILKKLKYYLDKNKDILNKDLLDNYPIDESNILYSLDFLIIKLENYKKSLINNIKNFKNTRDISYMLFFIYIIFALSFEVYRLNKIDKKTSEYLDNILYKNYDFNISNNSFLEKDQILNKLDILKNNLKTIEEVEDVEDVIFKGYSIKETLEEIYSNDKFKKYIKYNRMGFATLEGDLIVTKHNILDKGLNQYLNEGFSVKYNESNLKKLIENNEIRIINDLEKYYQDTDSSYIKLLLNEGFKSNISIPLRKNNGNILGIFFLSSLEKNAYTEIDKKKLNSIIKFLTYSFEKSLLIEDLLTSTIISFVRLVEGKDPETSHHIERMAIYSKIIAKNLSKYNNSINIFFIENIFKAAPLHDIGKVGIADSILLKPGKLTTEEFEIMKTHSTIGANILRSFKENIKRHHIDIFDYAIDVASSHHEKWDGTGYPKGLKGDEIPLAARIVSIADVFDALSNKRIYKKAFSFDESVNMIKEMKGKNFDPLIVDVFLESLPEIKEVYEELKEV